MASQKRAKAKVQLKIRNGPNLWAIAQDPYRHLNDGFNYRSVSHHGIFKVEKFTVALQQGKNFVENISDLYVFINRVGNLRQMVMEKRDSFSPTNTFRDKWVSIDGAIKWNMTKGIPEELCLTLPQFFVAFYDPKKREGILTLLRTDWTENFFPKQEDRFCA